MDGVALLGRAHEAGLRVTVDNGCLKIRGPRKSAAVSQLLISHKAAVIAALELNSSVEMGRDLQQHDCGPGTETPEIRALSRVSEPGIQPEHRFEGGRRGVASPIRPHRLLGNNYPPRASDQPPAAILATPLEICPRCDLGRVLPELRQMTGGTCWSCWEEKQGLERVTSKANVAARKYQA